MRWRGEADPDHVKAIDAYWISAAEHGMNASTFTARVVASTGADVRRRALQRRRRAQRPAARRRALARAADARRGRAERGDADALGQGRARPRRPPDGLRPPRLPRRGPARPRAAAHREGARRRRATRSPRRSSSAALAELQARKPDRVLATNVEFWSAVVLDMAEVPPDLFTPMFTCARVAGWSAHILEQKREGRLIRPTREVRRPRAAAGLRGRVGERRQRHPRRRALARVQGRHQGRRRHRPPGRARRDLRLPRPERRRQVDDGADARHAAAADRRARDASPGLDVATQGPEVRRTIGAALQEAALDDFLTGWEHIDLQGGAARAVEGRVPHARRGAARARRAERRRGAQGRRLLGRHEAPPGPRARAAARPARPLPRRADDRPRPAEPQRAVGGGRAARARGRRHRLPHDAVPRGGRRARRPRRDHRPRADRRRGHAVGAEGRDRRRLARGDARQPERQGAPRRVARARSASPRPAARRASRCASRPAPRRSPTSCARSTPTGISVSDLQLHQPSLDDVFLEKTGRSLEGADDDDEATATPSAVPEPAAR